MPVIDLDAHPDGLLLRLRACLGRMRTAVEEHNGLLAHAMGVEPVTLRDAAVLALCVAEHIGILVALESTPEVELQMKERIEFANSSILLALMTAGIRT